MFVVQPLDQGIIGCFYHQWQVKLVSWLYKEGGAGAGQAGQLASPDMKQAILWAQDALRCIPDEVIKNC